MNDTHTPAGTSIRARVHPAALDRMHMFFDASVSSAFVELIANARRGGATRIDISTRDLSPPDGDRFEVTIRDDGRGIADPAVLLSFGESGWNEKLARSENPAGMGLLSLAKHGCTLASRPKSPAAGHFPFWRVKLEPEHFMGKAAAAVMPDDTAPAPHGTRVTFEVGQTMDALRAAVGRAALFAPLPVTFDGDALRRRDFLENVLRIEQWKGLTLGIGTSRVVPYTHHDLNFHGLTVNARLPHVQTLNGEVWTVSAEVMDCPELELVLPARNQAVENAFLEELRNEARLAIYRALAPMDPPPRVAFKDHQRAARAGIDLPVPPAELRPWVPAIADVDNWTRPGSLAPVGPDTVVVVYDADPHETQPFYRAAQRAALTPRLFESDRSLEGYDWYDALPRLTEVYTEIQTDGAILSREDLYRRFLDTERTRDRHASRLAQGCAQQGGGALQDGCAPQEDCTQQDGCAPQEDCAPQGNCSPQEDRAEAIVMRAEITRPDGDKDIIAVPADVAFLGDFGYVEYAWPVIVSGSDISAEDLAELLRHAYFCPSDDSDADSYATQLRSFEIEALHLAVKHVASADEATRAVIQRAVWQEIHWLMPKDRHVNIAVHGNDVFVKLGPPPGA